MIATELDQRFYPELAAAGGLAHALQAELLNSGLLASQSQPFHSALVEKAPRTAQVLLAVGERAFRLDLFDGERLALSGWTPSLSEVVQAIVAFEVEAADHNLLARSFAWLEPKEVDHDEPVGEYVVRAWTDLAKTLREEPAPRLRWLAPLVESCARRPRLAALFPYTSVVLFRLSRTTRFPYTVDCPHAYALDENVFRVLQPGPKGFVEPAGIIGDGDAEQAAELIEENLPADCGAATRTNPMSLKGLLEAAERRKTER